MTSLCTLIGLATVMLHVVVFLVACSVEPESKSSDDSINFLRELGGDNAGFERACETRQFDFPQDHAAHLSFRNEWWYITGNVTTENSDRYGFQMTFFRVANIAGNPDRVSNWASNQFYMAHFAISSATSGELRHHERFARAAAGLAGAATSPTRVWLEDWRLQQDANDPRRWGLQVSQNGESLELSLHALKPLVLQGDAGYSRKSADPCNASFYYSYSRMQVSGKLRVDGAARPVSGTAWFDREWSSSVLSADQQGWDWFALQLHDGRELMYYRLRQAAGVTDDFSYAVLIEADGSKTTIDTNSIHSEVKQWWQSDTGSRYPVAGSLVFPEQGLSIHYDPLFSDQELDLTVRYWEGALQLTNEKGREVGVGYLELTGY